MASWSFEFSARTKNAAIDYLNTQSAPDAAKAYVTAAIIGLSADNADRIINVKASGMMADATDALNTSTCQIVVNTLTIAA